MKDNKMIAEFMGLESREHINVRDLSHTVSFFVPVVSTGYEGGNWLTCGDLPYHTWNWLMPVVSKIESLGYVFTIQGGKAEYGEMISEARCFIEEDKLTSTYTAVIEFIKEYNDEQ